MWGMASPQETLSLELHFGADLATYDVIDKVQAFLSATAIQYSAGLRVLRYERDRDAIMVDVRRDGELRSAVLTQGGYRGETYKALASQDRPSHARRFGEALVYGADRSMWLSVQFDEYVPAKPSGDRWLFSNSITVHIDRARVGDSARALWALRLITEVGADPRLLWGASFLDSEFRAKNLHYGPDGMWALGRDVRASLPGVYWANVFGDPYIRMMGRGRLASVPAQVLAAGKNVVVVGHDEPEDWAKPAVTACIDQIARHIGGQYFFDRRAPDRQTQAPDLGLQPLPQRDPLRVLATDDDAFTILP
jgi:hypothetical protein